MAILDPSSSGRRANLRFWLINVAAWSLFTAAVATAVYADLVRSGRPGSWLRIFGQYCVFYTPWMLVTPLVFWWVARHPLARDGWRRQGAGYVLFLALWLAIYLPLESALLSLVSYGSLASIGDAFRSIPFNAWVLDSVFLLTLFGVASARDMSNSARRQEREAAQLAIENAELSARLSGAQLQMLKAQLEPHFLFNALNSITALIRSAEPEEAVDAVGLLSELLRYATRAAASDRVSLEEEVDFVEAYLGFQQLRYGDRMTCHLDIEASAASVMIPPLILQPLLENAIRHGVEQIEIESQIWLTVCFRGTDLVISVKNAPAPPTEASTGLGIGLANTRERLEVIYGRTIDLRLSAVDDGFIVELVLPREMLEP